MQEEIKRIVDNCQKRKTNHVKNIKLLRLVFNSNNYDQFLEQFLRHVEGTIQSDIKNPYVRNVLEFLAMFVSTVASTNAKEATKDDTAMDSDTGSEEETHPFLRVVVERVIQYSTHKEWTCRYNTCMFLCMTLQNTEGEMDDKVIDLIQEAMLACIKDSKPLVRLEAVRAIHRCQDPSNPHCPVVTAISKRLTDSNPKVRKEAVKYIAPTARTVVHIKDSVFDKDPSVRCNAFTHVADLSMKYFKIAQRQEIMWAGFAEVNSVPKKKFKEYLLPKWLTSSGGSYINMLQAIKLDAEEKDIKYTEELSQKIVEAFFETKPITELIEALPLNDSKVIPENDVRSELVLYWNMLVKHLRKSDEMEEYLGQVLPELTPFCQYIDRLIVNKYSKLGDDWEKVNFQYLLYHLFDMAAGYDLSEEMGRRTLDQLIKSVISKHRLQSRLLNKLIQIDSKSVPNIDSFTTEICTILSEIWQPMTEQPVNEHEVVEKKYEISNLKVQINIMQENQDVAISEKRFDLAHELTQEINGLNVKLEQLQEALKATEQARTATQSSDDPEILCWCLELLASLLAHGNVRKLSPSLITCLEEFLLPLVQSPNVDIQVRAFKCLADYCILDRKLAEEHLKTLGLPLIAYRILPNYNKSMVIDSVKALTDLLRLYGTGFFDTDDESLSQHTVGNRRKLYSQSNEEDPNTTRDNPLTTEFIIAGYFEMIDDEDDDIRVTSLTLIGKLMLTGFPVEPIMLTRLVLKWICPTTHKAFQFKLGNVFSKYIAWIPNARQTMAQSIVTILTSIADAPRTSPLADIDVDDVLGFLVCVTDSDNNTNLVHTSLAKKLLQEISMNPTDKATMYFSKMLNLLKLPPADTPEVQELLNVANNIQETESLEKVPKKNLSKFVMKLLGQKANSTTASVNITLTTANTTQNTTTGTQLEDAGHQRRLSSVIEEDLSENEGEAEERSAAREERSEAMEEDRSEAMEERSEALEERSEVRGDMSETREERREAPEDNAEEAAPPKKRRIDLSDDVNGGSSEIYLNSNATTNNGAVEIPTRPTENAESVLRDNSSSDPDIIPDSQDIQSMPKPSAIQNKGKNNNNNNVDQISQGTERITRNLRNNKIPSNSSISDSSVATTSPKSDRENGNRNVARTPLERLRRPLRSSASTESLTEPSKNTRKLQNAIKPRNPALRLEDSRSEPVDNTPDRRSVRTAQTTGKRKTLQTNSSSSNSTSSQELPVRSTRGNKAINPGSKTEPSKKTQIGRRLRNGSLRLDHSNSESVDSSPTRRSARTETANKNTKRGAKSQLNFASSDGGSDDDSSPEPRLSKTTEKEPAKKAVSTKKAETANKNTKKTAQSQLNFASSDGGSDDDSSPEPRLSKTNEKEPAKKAVSTKKAETANKNTKRTAKSQLNFASSDGGGSDNESSPEPRLSKTTEKVPAKKAVLTKKAETANKNTKRTAKSQLNFASSDGGSDDDSSPEPRLSKTNEKEPAKKAVSTKKAETANKNTKRTAQSQRSFASSESGSDNESSPEPRLSKTNEKQPAKKAVSTKKAETANKNTKRTAKSQLSFASSESGSDNESSPKPRLSKTNEKQPAKKAVSTKKAETANKNTRTAAKSLLNFASSDGGSDNASSPEPRVSRTTEKEPAKKAVSTKKVNGVLPLQISTISNRKRNLLRNTKQNNNLKRRELVVILETTNKSAKKTSKSQLNFPSSDDFQTEPRRSKSKQKEPAKKTVPTKKVNGVLTLQNSPISNGKTDLLRTARQNNHLKRPELVVRINKISVPTKPLQKTAQVKRKKLRKSKSTSDESKENIQESDTSMDGSFHTFVQPDQFQQSIMEDSESETTTERRRSSRRLQVVDSETSSDENLSKSARRSTRSPRKKTYDGFVK